MWINLENLLNSTRRLTLATFFSKILVIYVIAGINLYGAFSFFYQRNVCHQINEKKHLDFICDTYFPTWLAFEIPSKLFRLGIFLAQYISILVILHRASTIMYLVYECTEILITHINVLKKNIGDLMEIKLSYRRSQGLRRWIELHNHLLL